VKLITDVLFCRPCWARPTPPQRDGAQLKLQNAERDLCTALLALSKQLLGAAAAKDADAGSGGAAAAAAPPEGGRRKRGAGRGRGGEGPAPKRARRGSGRGAARGEAAAVVVSDSDEEAAGVAAAGRQRVRFADGASGGGAGPSAAGEGEGAGEGEDGSGGASGERDLFPEAAPELRAAALAALEDAFQVGGGAGRAWDRRTQHSARSASAAPSPGPIRTQLALTLVKPSLLQPARSGRTASARCWAAPTRHRVTPARRTSRAPTRRSARGASCSSRRAPPWRGCTRSWAGGRGGARRTWVS
jgi:hypothetical protein